MKCVTRLAAYPYLFDGGHTVWSYLLAVFDSCIFALIVWDCIWWLYFLLIISVIYFILFFVVVCRHASNLVHRCHIGHCFETYQPWTEESKDTSGCWVFFGVDHGASTQSTLFPIFNIRLYSMWYSLRNSIAQLCASLFASALPWKLSGLKKNDQGVLDYPLL